MLNPCNANKSYVLGSSTYNLSMSSINPRYSLAYVKPTQEMFLKHKKLILEHTTLTNGPGIIPGNDVTTQINYKLGIDSVQYNNRIITIPCRFRPYITTIQQLLNQGQSIQTVFNALSIQYNLPDLYNTTSIYQFQRLYTYPEVNYITPLTTVLPPTNTISISFKTRTVPIQNTTFLDTSAYGINWSIILQLNQGIFGLAQNCQLLEVLNNDGKTFTSNFNDLLPNGSASYLGATLINNTVKNINTTFHIYVEIHPQEQNRLKTNGVIVNANSVPILQQALFGAPLIDYILFVPNHNLNTIMTYEPYPSNMAFTIINNSTLKGIVKPCNLTTPYSN